MVKRIISTDFWDDEKVIDQFSPEDKYFMLYLLTNPKTTSIGIYKLPKKIASFDLGYTRDTINVLLDRFQNKYENIVYFEEEQEIAVLNSLKYTISKGGKPIEDMVERELKAVKSTGAIKAVYDHLSTWWSWSDRAIDESIQLKFENELTKRSEAFKRKEAKEKNINANANANANTESLSESLSESVDDSLTRVPYEEITDYLNEKAGSQFRSSTKKTQSLIKARFNEGFKIDDFKRVIDIKTNEWLNNKDMSKYLRPETLFGTKFESYLNQEHKPVSNNSANEQWLNQLDSLMEG